EKAAREMSDRVDTLLGSNYSSVTVATFHAFCQQILERYGLDIGLPSPFKLLTPPQCWRLMKKNSDRLDLNYYRPLATPTRFLQALISHFSRCKDELILPEEYLHYAEEMQGDTDDERALEVTKTKEIADAYHTYAAILLEHNALDFGDLLLYTHKLLATRPNVLRALQKQYRFILVDEFQDTNWAQYQFLRALTTDEANIAVVGDDDQSIYKWRGAAISNILQFTKDFPGARTAVLTTNYRSAQTILDHAYAFIQHNNPNRLEVRIGIDKHLRAGRALDGTVTYLQAPTGEAEARLVAGRIAEFHEQGTPWNEMAVLARANSHLDAFVQGLRKAGIPYQYHAATGLLKTPLAVTCVSILRTLLSHHDHAALYRVVQMPMFRLNPDDHAALWWLERKGFGFYDALNRAMAGAIALSDEGKIRVERLLWLLRDHAARIHDEPVGVVLLSFLEQSGFIKYLADQSHGNDPDALETLLQLQALFDLIEQFSVERPENATRAFVEYVDDLLESGDEGGSPRPLLVEDAVQLLTIHSAKGLEFQHVFIVNLVERRFPTDARGDAIPIPDALIKEFIPEGDHHTEEERRLFYVALTRAKKSVTITGAANYGGARDKKPSRFIAELGVAPLTLPSPPEGRGITATASALPTPDHTTAQLPLPDHFSFSQLKAYENCPLQYKFAHLLHIPTRGKPT
ncbi:MAG: ATP-dependent helicase, partial [Patescibacteria group bacterium]